MNFLWLNLCNVNRELYVMCPSFGKEDMMPMFFWVQGEKPKTKKN